MNKDMCCPVCGNYIDVEEIYQQGRADQKAEDNEFFNFGGAWRLEKQKIREDAIDECIEIVARETQDGTLCDYLEALKEQKQ